MTEENYWYSQLEPKLAPEAVAEAKIIVDAFRAREIPIEIGGSRDDAEEDDDLHPGGIAFMYAEDRHSRPRTVSRRDRTGRWDSQRSLWTSSKPTRSTGDPQQDDNRAPEVEVMRVVGDVVLLCLNPRRHKHTRDYDYGDEGAVSTPTCSIFSDRIDDELGQGIATPDHVLTAANGGMTPCSATEPQQVYPTAGPYPAVCRDGGARVRIFQADTGLVEKAAQTFPWLAGVHGDPDPRAGTGQGSTISPYGGHGTFVAGVLRCMAPQAQVHVENIFDTGGQRAGIGRREEAQCGLRLRLRDRPHNGLVPYLEEHPAAGPGSLAEAASARTRVSLRRRGGQQPHQAAGLAGRIP